MARAFRAYAVGIAKSGTTSIAGIFANFRSAHEFMFEETTRAIADYRCGLMNREQFRRFLRERDRRGNLEMDAASFNAHYADILLEEFPDARFILTIRDCHSWLESLLNMLLMMTEMPVWMVEYGRRAFGSSFSPAMTRTRDDLIEHAPELIGHALQYWAGTNRSLLGILPPEKRYVVRTNEIGVNLDGIAAFAGVDRARLRADNAHMFQAPYRSHILLGVEPAWLQSEVDRHCHDLMTEHFPDQSLDDFLFDSFLESIELTGTAHD